MRVCSDELTYLKLTAKDYRDKIFRMMPERVRHRECEKFTIQDQINKELEYKKFKFFRENRMAR